MSKYENIIPNNSINSHRFEYRGASIEIVVDSCYYPDYPSWQFFSNKPYGSSTGDNAPPHYVGIKSDIALIVDRFDFTVCWDQVAMTVKDYKIESSIDGETWNTLYIGTVPNTDFYTKTCEFNPTICKYIRFAQLTTYDTRGYKWLSGGQFKIYGTLAAKTLYTNQDDAYAIPKKDGDS